MIQSLFKVRINKPLIPAIFVGFMLMSMANAAEVPSGVVLAQNQRLVMRQSADPESLDPHKISGEVEFKILADLLEGLVTRGPQGEIAPGVAARWENENLRIWTFHLRPGLRWSNGEFLTAHDFVYSWRRLVDPVTASGYASYLADSVGIKNAAEIFRGEKLPESLGVEAVDDLTLKITLNAPNLDFIKTLLIEPLSPIHKATVEKYQNAWTRPENWVGNGPFVLKNQRIGEHVTLVKNAHYRENEKTVLEEVIYLALDNEAAALARYRAGEIDVNLYGLSAQGYQTYKKTVSDLFLLKRLGVEYYGFNLSKPPFDDLRVRKALCLAIDREVLVNQVIGLKSVPAYTLVPPYIKDYRPQIPQWATWTRKARLEEANRLLKEAGYTEKSPLKFRLLYSHDKHKKVASAICQMWKTALKCVHVDLIYQEWKIYLELLRGGGYEIIRRGWEADYESPLAMLSILYSASSQNTTGYCNQAYDSLLTQASREESLSKRTALCQEAERVLAQDYAVAPLYFDTPILLVKPYVKGLSESTGVNHFSSRHLYIVAH